MLTITFLEFFFFFLIAIFFGYVCKDIADYLFKKKYSLEEIIELHNCINEVLNKIRQDTYAERVLLFQAKNGDYLLGGTPLMKLLLTNERVNFNKKIVRIKGKIKEIDATIYDDAITLLKKEKAITLSKTNDYEGFETSYEALINRGMHSGIYIKIADSSNNRLIAILAIEYISDAPLFVDRNIIKMCEQEIHDLTKLVNQKQNKLHF